ncbi:MAG: UbiA family prenyltransferase [Promethearchaeota archaeon]
MTKLRNYLKLVNHPAKIMPIINYTLLVIFGAVLFNSNSPLTTIFFNSNLYFISLSFDFNKHLIPLILVIISVDSAWYFAVGVNDYYDVEIDKVINPNRPLVKGDLTKGDVKKFTIFFGSISVIIALICSLLYNFWIIIFTGIYLLSLGFLYSAPPVRIKMRTSLSTMFIGLTCSTTVLSGGVLILNNEELIFSSSINNELIFASITIGIIAFLASIGKDFKDIPGDEAAGIPTLPIKYGAKNAAKILLITGMACYSVFFLYPIFDNIYLLSYPSIIFAITSWILVFIYYIKNPGKERAETLYKLGFMGFLVIIFSNIILKLIF